MAGLSLDTLDIHSTDLYLSRGYPWKEWDLLRQQAPVQQIVGEPAGLGRVGPGRTKKGGEACAPPPSGQILPAKRASALAAAALRAATAGSSLATAA